MAVVANGAESTETMVWYFAYGSNLSNKQMNERVGTWKDSKKATLRGWKLVFNVPSRKWGGAAANIVSTCNPADAVFGAIYLITRQQLDILTTKHEHVLPITLTVETEETSEKAEVYVFKNSPARKHPPDGYLQTILIGLKDHGYPDESLKSIEKLAH